MKAPEFLQEAKETMEERGKTYDTKSKSTGGAERSMGRTIAAFNAITGEQLTESHGWLIMLLLKQVRQHNSVSYHHDSAMDSVAYAALLAESLSAEHAEAVRDVFDIPVGSPLNRDKDVVITEEDLIRALNVGADKLADELPTNEMSDAEVNLGATMNKSGCDCIRKCFNMGNAIYNGKGDTK